jgi:hypothetical protein
MAKSGVPAEYFIRRKPGEGGIFEVSKFQGGSVPLTVYEVSFAKYEGDARVPVKFEGQNMLLRCDCPAGANNRKCKHLGWVKDWIETGMPVAKQYG